MRVKKILYITVGLNVGGAEKFLLTLSDGLAKNLSSQLIVCLSEDINLKPELNKSIELKLFPRRYKLNIFPVFKLRKLIRTEKPDLIICINFFTFFLSKIATFLSFTKTKRIISYHTTIHLSRKELFLHKLYKFFLNQNDKIITVSKNQAYYSSRQLKISESKFQTIYNGVDIQYWNDKVVNSYEEIRTRYNVPLEAKIIIKVAMFREEKNHLGAIKALDILHNKYNLNAYLLFLGEGIMLEKAKKLATSLNIQKYIIFAGLQSDVRPFLHASNLFTLCSTSVETFSISALEAMASGLPCVLTDIGGANEMIINGKNGYLCQLNEKDISLNWHKALVSSFNKEEIYNHTSKNFNRDKMIEEYKKALLN